MDNLKVQVSEPNYFYRDYANDFGKTDSSNSSNGNNFDSFTRFAQAALPFISLYQPAKAHLPIILGISRSATRLFSLQEAWNGQEKNKIAAALLRTAVSVASLAGSYFAPPLGMLISTGEDLVNHAMQLVDALNRRDYENALVLTTKILSDSLYLSLFFTGASEIVIASLSLQILLGLHQSYHDFKEEKYLEAFSQLVMSCIRGYQLKTEIGIFQLQRAISQHMNAVEKEASKIDNATANILKGDGQSALKEPQEAKKNITNEPDLDEHQILQRAEEYLNDPEILKKQAAEINLSKLLPSSASDHEIIDTLLQDQAGFCVGENHHQDSARAFLINNMDYLKSKNVKVLFSEGWDYKTQKTMDKYFSVQHLRELEFSDRQEVQTLLDHSINHLNNKLGSPYTAFALMEKAKSTGIRLVGIDYKHEIKIVFTPPTPATPTNLQDYAQRYKSMNFVAAQVIEATRETFKPNEKFVALTGSAHLRKYSEELPVPGIADLTQTPALWIQDKMPFLPKEFPSLWYSKLNIKAAESSPVNILLRESI